MKKTATYSISEAQSGGKLLTFDESNDMSIYKQTSAVVILLPHVL